ncbi:MAG: HU family DNA-binding protein [Acidobacteriota bacterium]|nr:MAG: HU family DNA-binding protein [Acidobacteriota bacterium]
MNRSQLTERLAARAGLSLPESRRVLQVLFSTVPGEGLIVDALDRGERVMVSGFGTFFASERGERRVIDPRDGTPRVVPSMRVARFRPGLALRDRLR